MAADTRTHPEGPARHLDVSRQKLSPHFLETIFDSQLPSPKLNCLLNASQTVSPHKRRVFFLFQIAPAVRVTGQLRETIVGLAPLQKIVGDFCCIKFGGFCRGFSWRIFLGTFSHKNEEKKSGDKIRNKIRRLKNKNPRKIRSAKNRP